MPGVHEESASVDLSSIAELVVGDFGAAPAAVVAAAIRQGGAWRFGAGAFGRLTEDASAPEATIETPFDLASLSKPFTSLTMARLERAGTLRRDEPIEAFLPALEATPSRGVPLVLFAAHRAGLDAHQKIYAPLVEGKTVDPSEAIVRAASARRVECFGPPPPQGFPPIYSDMGYLILGAALATRARLDLDALVEREVIEKLGLRVGSARRLRAADATFDARVAPTEIVDWRGLVRGAVHDENAFAIGGDASCGHAGLFGDARSIVKLGVAIVDALGERSDWLRARDLAPLVRDRSGGSQLAGFDRKSGDTPAAGARFGARTFGHLGFTGTSLWIDPEAEIVGVLLTNRVHPTREHLAIRRARPAAYDAIVGAMTRT